MSSEPALVRMTMRKGRWYRIDAQGNLTPDASVAKTDWARLDAMTDEEVVAAALSDPDAQPSTDEQLARLRRVPLAKHVRWWLGLSQTEFAARFHIPIGTLRDWEQHRTEPDTAALAYLKVIKADPDFVERALASSEPRSAEPADRPS